MKGKVGFLPEYSQTRESGSSENDAKHLMMSWKSPIAHRWGEMDEYLRFFVSVEFTWIELKTGFTKDPGKRALSEHILKGRRKKT